MSKNDSKTQIYSEVGSGGRKKKRKTLEEGKLAQSDNRLSLETLDDGRVGMNQHYDWWREV